MGRDVHNPGSSASVLSENLRQEFEQENASPLSSLPVSRLIKLIPRPELDLQPN